MTSNPETYVIVWFDSNDIPYSIAASEDGGFVTRSKDAISEVAEIRGILHTEDEIDSAEANVKYAIPSTLARDVFGWTV